MPCLLCYFESGTSHNVENAIYRQLSADPVTEQAILAYSNDSKAMHMTPILLDYNVNGSDQGPQIIRLIKRIRMNGYEAPVIVVANTTPRSGSACFLNAGADDVVVVNQRSAAANAEEIQARLNAIMRRIHKISETEIIIGNLKFPLDGAAPKLKDTEIQLSAREYDILKQLALNQGKIVSKAALYDMLYALTPLPPLDKIIDVYICRLRAKIKGNEKETSPNIETLKGRGYRLVA